MRLARTDDRAQASWTFKKPTGGEMETTADET